MTLVRKALGAIRAQRAVSLSEDGTLWKDWSEDLPTARQRRAYRTAADISATYSSVFAAVRKRSQMAAKATLHLMRGSGKDAVEIEQHPALDALRRINETLTAKQGQAIIEQHKLTFGAAYWVKRRNRLGVPVEFEIWNPEQVEVKPRADKPWTVESFRRHRPNSGTIESVSPEDVIMFRHFLDPRNLLYGLSPIGAVRVQVDTGMEAVRYNQRFFDNNAMPAALFSAKEAGKGEVERIRQELERDFRGTDNSFRLMIAEGDLSVTAMPMAHKDMQFLEQMRWNREEVAAVYEMSPVLIGDTSQATKENLEGYELALWTVMVNQVENTVEELNEFFIRPDFGEAFFLTATFDDVAILQADRKLQAEIDEINLRTAKTTINRLRARDGEEPVAWGDVPIVNNVAIMGPLDFRTAEERETAQAEITGRTPSAPSVEPPRMFRYRRSIGDTEEEQREGWGRRLRRELRGIIAHLEAADARAFGMDDVDGYDWDWYDRYGPQVMAELTATYEASLLAADFTETPLLPTHELAVRYARARAGDLLVLDGRANIVQQTRERVRTVVADAIANGDSLRTLKNALRQDNAFSGARAQTIARTETATAQGKASLQAYSSNGYEGKRWLTAGNALDEDCNGNEAQGAIALRDAFASGHDAPPAHPNCLCVLLPVYEFGR